MFDDRVPENTFLRFIDDDVPEGYDSAISPAKALHCPRQITLQSPRDRLVLQKKMWLDAMGLRGFNRAHIVLGTKDIEDIHNLVFMHGARLGNNFDSGNDNKDLDELLAFHSMTFFAAARTQIDERGWAIFPGVMDDALLSRDCFDALFHTQSHHDVKEFLPWFESNFPGASVMQKIALGLEPKNLAWMPICNSRVESKDSEESRQGKSHFSTTHFGMGWYIEAFPDRHHIVSMRSKIDCRLGIL